MEDDYATNDNNGIDDYFVDGDIPPQRRLNCVPPTGFGRCPDDNRGVFDHDKHVNIHPTVKKRLRARGLMNVRESGIYICSSLK